MYLWNVIERYVFISISSTFLILFILQSYTETKYPNIGNFTLIRWFHRWGLVTNIIYVIMFIDYNSCDHIYPRIIAMLIFLYSLMLFLIIILRFLLFNASLALGESTFFTKLTRICYHVIFISFLENTVIAIVSTQVGDSYILLIHNIWEVFLTCGIIILTTFMYPYLYKRASIALRGLEEKAKNKLRAAMRRLGHVTYLLVILTAVRLFFTIWDTIFILPYHLHKTPLDSWYEMKCQHSNYTEKFAIYFQFVLIVSIILWYSWLSIRPIITRKKDTQSSSYSDSDGDYDQATFHILKTPFINIKRSEAHSVSLIDVDNEKGVESPDNEKGKKLEIYKKEKSLANISMIDNA